MNTTHRAPISLPGRDLWSRGSSRTPTAPIPIVIPAPSADEPPEPEGSPRTVELPARHRDGRVLRDLGELYDR